MWMLLWNLRTLQAYAIALEALHSLLEERLARRGHSGHIILLPFNRGIDIFEDLLDRVCDFCTYTITGNERHLARS